MTDTDTTAAATTPSRLGDDLTRHIDRPRRSAKVREAMLWETENSDHSPNVGSYAVQAACGMVDVAVEILLAAGRDPKELLVRWTAEHLMWVADEIQAGVRSDGRHDRMANSHSRARGVLRTVITIRPFPVEAALDTGTVPPTRAAAVHNWHSDAVNAGIRLLRLAVDLSGVDWRTAQ